MHSSITLIGSFTFVGSDSLASSSAPVAHSVESIASLTFASCSFRSLESGEMRTSIPIIREARLGGEGEERRVEMRRGRSIFDWGRGGKRRLD